MYKDLDIIPSTDKKFWANDSITYFIRFTTGQGWALDPGFRAHP